MKSLSRIIGLALLVCGCGGDGVSLAGACEEMASAIAEASERCEDNDRAVAYQSYLEYAVNGSCHNVVGIRDNVALQNDCIPALSSIECSAFIRGTLSPACKDQLIIDR